MLRDGEDWKQTVADAFEGHEDKVCRLVSGASPEDWHHLNNLFMTISNARPSFAARVIESWDPASAADVLNRTHPNYYDSVRWFLGGSVWKHSQRWCDEVGRLIDWTAISQNLSQIQPGDINTVNDCLSILKRLGVPIMRSMIRRMAEVVRDKLAGAPLSDIRFHPVMIVEIEVFPEEMRKVAGVLDARRLADEISRTPPHKWDQLMHLSWIGARAGSSFPQDIVEYLNDNALIETVRKYAEAHPRIFLPLLWQLAYGRPERRHELAMKLYQSALIACRQKESERDQILRAFAKIDDAVARDLARELKVALPEPGPDDDKAEILNRPILEHADGGREVEEQLKVLEEAGEDYDVGIIINGP